jgi:hypothetical protein
MLKIHERHPDESTEILRVGEPPHRNFRKNGRCSSYLARLGISKPSKRITRMRPADGSIINHCQDCFKYSVWDDFPLFGSWLSLEIQKVYQRLDARVWDRQGYWRLSCVNLPKDKWFSTERRKRRRNKLLKLYTPLRRYRLTVYTRPRSRGPCSCRLEFSRKILCP